MKNLRSLTMGFVWVLFAVSAMAASDQSIDKEQITFRALSKISVGVHMALTPLTDGQLGSVKGGGSWGRTVFIEQITGEQGINIAIVRQTNGESKAVIKQISEQSTAEVLEVSESPGVSLIAPIIGHTGTLVEQLLQESEYSQFKAFSYMLQAQAAVELVTQLLKSHQAFAEPRIVHALRNDRALGRWSVSP